MYTTETFLRAILEQKAIGAARIGGPSSAVIERYGNPVGANDLQREGGVSCEIWDYDDLQIGTDPSGVIRRILFDPANARALCLNPNFNYDMAMIRTNFLSFDLWHFKDIVGREDVETKERSTTTEVRFEVDGMEVFAVFRATYVGGDHFLRIIRLTAV